MTIKIVGNAADGIRFEISRNGMIENNTITGNGFGTGRGSGTSLWDGGGINVNTSTGVTVRDNTGRGNVNGVTIQSRTRGTARGARYLLRDIQVTGNTIEMTGGTQATGMVQNSGAAVPAGEADVQRQQIRPGRASAPSGSPGSAPSSPRPAGGTPAWTRSAASSRTDRLPFATCLCATYCHDYVKWG